MGTNGMLLLSILVTLMCTCCVSGQTAYGRMLTTVYSHVHNRKSSDTFDTAEKLNEIIRGYDYLKSQLLSPTDSVIQELKSPSNVSHMCQLHINMTAEALLQRQPWTIKFLDSFGKPGAGFTDGNIYWIGSYPECTNITATVYRPINGTNVTSISHPFKGRYCKFGVPLGAPAQSGSPLGGNAGIPVGELQVGICVPDSCSAQDVLLSVNKVFALIPPAYANISIDSAVCQLEDLEWSGKAIVCMVVMSLLAILVIAGTAYDMLVVHKVHQEVQREPTTEENAPLIGTSVPNEGSHNIIHRGYGSGQGILTGTNGDGDHMVKNIQETSEIGSSIGRAGQLLIAFSIYTNGSKMLSTKRTAGTLGVLNGMRFISMSWVILGHSFAFTLMNSGRAGQLLIAFSVYTNGSKMLSTKRTAGTLGVLNGMRFLSMSWVILGHSFGFSLLNSVNTLVYISEKTQSFSFLVILNATVSVDTFFTLSGLLVGYLSLKELQKVGGVKNFRWGMFYFHRFWRLTPPYMLVLFLYTTTNKYWANGPFWNQLGMERDECTDSWWKSILYINNFFPAKDTCMAWSWYLANDMQFYIVSPLFLIPLYINGYLGVCVCIFGLLGTFIVNGVMSSVNNLPMTLFGGGGDGGMEQMGFFFDKVYVRPYCRIGPYIVGLLFGYLLYKTDSKPRMTRWMNILGWLMAAGCCLSVLYANYGTISGKDVSGKHITALYNALHTTVWAGGVCWVIYACATGYGGPVNKFLSWSVFIPLSRLTYLAYLIHPVIILVFNSVQLQPAFLSDFTIVYQFIGHLVFANAGAFVLSLVFESPFMGIEKTLLKRERKH